MRLGRRVRLRAHAPIAHLAKARVLGRLNVLAGMRLAARGQVDAAVERWLAGIRFSQHLAQGGTLISLFSANSVLIPSLNALTDAASRRALGTEQGNRIQAALQAFPETGFDWADAMTREGEVSVVGVRLHAVPSLRMQDLAGLRTTVTRIADALRLPPDRARTVLSNLNLGSFPLPSQTRINGVREDIQAARQRVLSALPR